MIRERDFGCTPNASFPANQRDGYLRRQRRDLYNPQFAAGNLFAQIPFRIIKAMPKLASTRRFRGAR